MTFSRLPGILRAITGPRCPVTLVVSAQFREAQIQRREKRIGLVPAVLCLCVLAGATFPVHTLRAGEPTGDLNSPEVVRQVLEQQVGNRVKVKLLSGQDLDGKVAKVGTQAVMLSELSGMEFFDATLRLDQVAAVVVKARGK